MLFRSMKENEASLSQACKNHLVKMKEARKDIKEACQEDVESFCSDVGPGKGHLMKCMKENKEKLSAACQREIQEKKEMHKKAKKKS